MGYALDRRLGLELRHDIAPRRGVMADREVLKRRFVPAPLALAAWLLVLACSLAPAPAPYWHTKKVAL